MTRTSGPVSAAEADALFAPLSRFDVVLLAVSGGADSIALLELAAAWRRRAMARGGEMAVATVDHGLRAQSRDEAEFVAARCAALGLAHAILTWRGDKPSSGLASAAREARYALLAEYARAIAPAGRVAIVTAHTEDDQAETLVMRLARGSGVDGLAAMADVRVIDGARDVYVARPLLATPKARLVETLDVAGLTWREDPSNSDAQYERVRIRAALKGLEAAGVAAPALAQSARRMQDARAALDYADQAFEAALGVDFHNEIYASFDRAAYDAAPALLRVRLLARLVTRFGGATPAPRLAEIEALTARLSQRTDVRATLGGAVASASARTIKVWREAGRLDSRGVVLAPATPVIWDNRFVVACDGRDDLAVSVRPLGADGLARLSLTWSIDRRPPSAALQSAPAFWVSGMLVGAPSLSAIAECSGHQIIHDLKIFAVPAGNSLAAAR